MSVYAKILFCFNQLSAGRPGGLMVLPSNTTNVWLSLSSTPTAMKYYLICQNAIKKRGQLLRAPARYNSTRVDEGRKCLIFLAVKMRTRDEVGREEEGPLCDPGSESLLGGSARMVRG